MTAFGQTKTVTATPTVDTSAYASGDLVGTLMTFALTDARSSSGVVHAVLITDRAAQKAALDLVLFTSALSNSTLTDNAPFDPDDDDLLTYVGHVSISASDYADFNDNSAAVVRGVGLPFNCAGGSQTLYGVLVSRGTPTYAASDDLTVGLVVLQD